MRKQILRGDFPDLRALAAMTLLCLLGCSSVSQSSVVNNNQPSNRNGATMEDQKDKPANDKVDARLASANTSFGFKLYGEVARQGAGKNIFISPSSIALCLAMAYNGAEGETKQAMARALEAQGVTLEELNSAYAGLRAALENPDPKVQLQIANSLWARKGIKFNPEFVKRNKQFYEAQLTELDFDGPAAITTINQWVSQSTRGKIDKIIDSIDRDTILFLINAIYFKGKWANEFAKDKTREDAFNLEGGSQKRAQMMSQSGSYSYYEAKNFQAVSLPYGGGRVSLYIFLPAKGTTLGEFQKGLTAANWEGWMAEFAESEGDITLPRFRTEYEVTLNDALKALGMEAAFDASRANFTGMLQGGQNAYISKVKHKTYVEVNEEGTEAAAVTSTEMRATSAMRPRQRFRMVVDRPFFCAIRDNTTKTVLFMGSIMEP
ncbi:MAG TPA: serpin family protein [Blastocatellia bacterium]|jgi:serpin B|nr:serpin family protein [Blastocatellia bacterium]